jgi:hypothetical protein
MNGPDQVNQVLHHNPSFHQLKALADRNGVIYVPRGYNDDDRPAGRKGKVTPRPTHSKLAVTRAILAGGLARTIVLSATLAHDLLQAPQTGHPLHGCPCRNGRRMRLSGPRWRIEDRQQFNAQSRLSQTEKRPLAHS